MQLQGRATAIVDEFDTYVRPRYNPILTTFAKNLTGIKQKEIDDAPPLKEALTQYLNWLCSHGLVDHTGRKIGRWAIATWSDADIGSQFAKEMKYKNMPIPHCFNNWINLKRVYKVSCLVAGLIFDYQNVRER